MTGCDPSALDARLERLRNVGESDLQGSRQLSSGLVAELADRAVLVGYVLVVADGGSDRGAGQRQRQGDDPSAPAWATSCEPRVRGIALGHQTADATRESPKAARAGADGRRHDLNNVLSLASPIPTKRQDLLDLALRLAQRLPVPRSAA